jgi:uncharacterized protein YprB with RNaseH-like and TPR domain
MIRTSEAVKGPSAAEIELFCRGIGCDKRDVLFIDIETTGLSPKTSDMYLIGVAVCKEEEWDVIQFFAENAYEEKEILSAFSDFLLPYKKIVHYNGDRFDIPFLKAKYEKYDMASPFEGRDSVDLYKLIKPYRNVLGLADGKQKTIESFLGIEREDEYDGGKLIPIYKEYTQFRDDERKHLLLLHNSDDVKGMMKLLPVMYYLTFFEMFKDLPRISVRTDEDVEESAYMTEEDGSERRLPLRAVKVTANKYRGFDGKEKSEVIMKLRLPFMLPTSLAGNLDGCFFKSEGGEASLRVPLFEEEMKYFYSNYKDYYYLPREDMAIHKSLAEFVDKDFREKAKPENCYTKKEGQYLMEWDLVFAPFFKRNYEDKSFFFDLNANMKKSRFAMSLYACHVVEHILNA